MISRFEAVIVILRAITKFIAVYRQVSPRMDQFIMWARDNGYPVPSSKKDEAEGGRECTS